MQRFVNTTSRNVVVLPERPQVPEILLNLWL